MTFLLYVTFILFSFGHVGRISFGGQLINGYFYEIFLAIFLTLLFKQQGLKPLQKSFQNWKFTYFFFGYMFFSLCLSFFFYSVEENFVAILYFVRLLFYYVYFVYFYHYIRDHQPFSKHGQQALVVTISLTIIISSIQYVFLPDLRILERLGWDPHLDRMLALFLDPPFTASIYALLFLFFVTSKNLLAKHIKIIICMLLLIGIFLTYSRGAYLAGLLTIIMYFLKQKKLNYIGISVLLFIVMIMMLPKKFGEGVNLLRTSTIESRIVDYQEGFKIWQKNPIFGIGYNHIRSEKAQNLVKFEEYSHAGSAFHSSFLVILVTGGIIGLILYVLSLVQIMQKGTIAFYGGVFLSIFSLTDNVLLHPFILFLFFSLIALKLTHHERT